VIEKVVRVSRHVPGW